MNSQTNYARADDPIESRFGTRGVRRSAFKTNKHPRRIRQIPKPAKPCQVYLVANSVPMTYSLELKCLLVMDNSVTGGFVPVFPSHRQAQSAIWHTLQAYQANDNVKPDGSAFHADDFEIRDVML